MIFGFGFESIKIRMFYNMVFGRDSLTITFTPRKNIFIMLSKTKVIKTIKELPDSFSIEELFDRIIFLQKIETGRQQSREGKIFSTAEAKKRLGKWLK
jgi:hypothetical protein